MYLQSAALLSFAVGAYANIYSLVATVPWAPGTPSSTDQSVIYNGTYYLSDRTNKGVHVVSLTNKTQTGFIGGFVTGLTNGTLTPAISGPDGVVVLPNRNEMYVGDGDGTVKVVNLFTNTVVAKIATGSKKRADELAYNPSTQTVIVTNANESPPLVNVLNATSRTVIGKISFPGADSLEQPAFNPTDSQFYVSVPETAGAPGGAIQMLNVNKASLSIAKTLPIPGCAPAGIVFGPADQVFIGCSGSQVASFGYAASYIMNVSTGAIIANISGITGSDQVTYSPKTGYYYASAYLNTVHGVPAPILAVISTKGVVVQKIATDNVTAHSVAVDKSTGTLVVPVKAKGILIYSLSSGSATNGTSGSATGTSPSHTSTSTSTSSTSDAQGYPLKSLAGMAAAALAFAYLL
jgi:DNA-binding beta-propeller fold protein YncE